MAQTVAASAAGGGHNFVTIVSLELVGVAILAIVADTSKAIGNVIVLLMVSFLMFWLITRGYRFIQAAEKPLGKVA